MFRTLRSWLRGTSKKKSVAGRRSAASLRLVPLEDRSLLSAAFPIDTLVNTFNAGVAAAATTGVNALVQSLNTVDLPLVQDTLASVTKLATQLAPGFVEKLTSTATTTVADLKAQLDHHDALGNGFTVLQLDQTPDPTTGNLVTLKYHNVITLPVGFTIGGDTKFDYFDKFVDGHLGGTVTAANATLTVDLVYGVDVVGGTPAFFVSDQSKVAISDFAVTGAVNGELAIRSLVDATVNGKLSGDLQGGLTLTDNDGVADHKVRIAGLAAAATPTASGNVTLDFGTKNDGANLGLVAHFPLGFDVPIVIKGSLVGAYANGNLTVQDKLVSQTTAADLFGAAVKGVLSIFGGNNLPFLGNGQDKSPDSTTNLATLLDQPLPLSGGKTILDELGLTSAADLKLLFSNPPAVPSTRGQTDSQALTSLQSALTPYGIQLLPNRKTPTSPPTDADITTAINSLIHGDKVDLIHFRKDGTFKFHDGGPIGTIPFDLLGFQGQVSLNLDGNVHADYKVGLGFDTTGFYLDPDTSVSIGGGVTVSVDGKVSDPTGLLGVTASAGVGVGADAGVKFYDPDPTDGKIYYDEIFNIDKSQSTVQNFLNSMTFYAQAQVQGDVKLVINLPIVPDVTVGEKQFKGDVLFSTNHDQHVVTAGGANTFRKIALVPTNPISVDQFVHVENGLNVLRIDDSRSTTVSNVHLGPASDGKVNVILFGRGAGTTSARIDKIVYVGSGLNDRLDVDPTLTVPIDAKGGAGDDYLTGGAGNDTLAGGEGNDAIFGNAGNDTITGDGGVNVLHGGAGNDALTAGSGGDAVSGDDGDDALTGGIGRDVLFGGAGNDTLAGGDQDQLLGGDGNDTLLGTNGVAFFDGGAGDDTVTGGTGADTISGGDGNDVLSGGAGDDRIDGGAGNDVITGGEGNDTLRGGDGQDRILGNGGDDRISGGRDFDTLFGDDQAGTASSGQDTFEVDFVNDAGPGTDAISGGPDRDTIAIVGQATLDANGKVVSFNDDILVSPGSDPGSITAGWRSLGSPAAYQQVTFSLTDPSDLIAGVDSIRVEGGAGNDRIELARTLTTAIIVDGGDGDDTILGSDGVDYLLGGAGNDTIDGRGGADTIYGDGDGANVTVLAAQAGNNTLHGGAGEDTIFGGDSSDTIDGGLDHDKVFGGAGDDLLTAGNDIGDELHGDAGDDTILGGDGIDELHGGIGNDTILGGDGSDTIDGGEGDDKLYGEFGRDTIYGGDNNDFLNAFYDDDSNAVRTAHGLLPLTTPTQDEETARYNTLEAEDVSINSDPYFQQLRSIPRNQLTPQQGDDLTRFSNRLIVLHDLEDDLLRFNTGKNDELFGEAGADTLIGSPFPDRLDGGADGDTYLLSPADVYGLQVTDSISDSGPPATKPEENDTFAIHGVKVDLAHGIDGVDHIAFRYEGDGNLTVLDTVNGNTIVLGHFGATAAGVAFAGIESLEIDGEVGDDTIDLSGLKDFVPLVGQVKVYGGVGNDTINASTYQGQTYLDGGDGNDTITGGAIADTINGQAGDDVINGGNGDNVIDGGDGNDRISAGVGNDKLYGGAGDDVINAGAGNDTVAGGDGNDKIDGAVGDDTLSGGNGDDRILGGSGNDTIYGDAGNDTLFGMAGNDIVNGGADNDYVNGDGVFLQSGGADGVITLSDNLASDGNDTLVGGLGSDFVYGDGGNDLIDNGPNAYADPMSADALDGGVGTDTVLVSFRNKQTWKGAETVTVVNPTGGKVYIAADQTVYGLQNGTVFANGQGVNTSATNFGVNSRNELYVLTTSYVLIKYTRAAAGGPFTTATLVHAGVQSFDGFDSTGTAHYTLFPIPNI